MMFHLISDDTLRATLSAQDVGLLGLSFDQKDPEALLTLRFALLTVLAEAQASVGFYPEGGHLSIELYPEADGGCTVLFHAAGGEEIAPPRSAVYRFDDAEALIEASIRLFKRNGQLQSDSALYRLGGAYRLVVRLRGKETDAVARLLSEYAAQEEIGTLAAALVEEHGAPILTEHAVDTLAYYFDR